MAKCDEGYLCDVCGKEVPEISGSDLYLRYVIGEIGLDDLNAAPERHLRCNPVQAQFIVDPRFPPVTLTGLFDKKHLDPVDVARREDLVTRGWQRLQELAGSELGILEYPLPEVLARSEK